VAPTMKRAKRDRLAQALKRVPWLVEAVIMAMRWTQAHYTAGVVGVVLNTRGEVLLVEHVLHPNCPWGLPGGWMGRREDPATTLKRELQEELGLEVQIIRPLLIQNDFSRINHLDIAFLCEAANNVSQLSRELLDYRWLTADQAPPLKPFHAAALAAAATVLNSG